MDAKKLARLPQRCEPRWASCDWKLDVHAKWATIQWCSPPVGLLQSTYVQQQHVVLGYAGPVRGKPPWKCKTSVQDSVVPHGQVLHWCNPWWICRIWNQLSSHTGGLLALRSSRIVSWWCVASASHNRLEAIWSEPRRLLDPWHAGSVEHYCQALES